MMDKVYVFNKIYGNTVTFNLEENAGVFEGSTNSLPPPPKFQENLTYKCNSYF